VHTDWSHLGIGAVLGQRDDSGAEYIVACVSRRCNEHEARYPAWKGELLAVTYALTEFRVWLQGSKFLLVTDHRPLLYLLREARLGDAHNWRWAALLHAFDFDVVHRAGKKHINADVLSRYPQPRTFDVTGAQLDLPHDQLPLGLPRVLLPDGSLWQPTLEDAPTRLELEAPSDGTPVEVGVASVFALAPMPVMRPAQVACAALRAVQAEPAATSWIDAFAPSADELLAGNTAFGADDLAAAALAASALPVSRELQRQRVVQAAGNWLAGAQREGLPVPAAPLPGKPLALGGEVATPDADLQVCTAPVGAHFVSLAAGPEGVTVYEPFGGICAGLEAALRAGVRVKRYIYSDTSPVARGIARHRFQQLADLYPRQVGPDAFADSFTTLPQDVYATTPEALAAAVRRSPGQWLVVAGWECQDLSPAGGGAGLHGMRLRSFFQLVRILRALQLLMPTCPPAFVVENTSFQLNNGRLFKKQYAQVCSMLGPSALLDAARFGSRAHRLRNFWTNILPPEVLQAVCDKVRRPEGLKVEDILDPGRVVAPAVSKERAPWYQCNVPGEPLSAWPTLVARAQSYAFRPGGKGAVFDTISQQWCEPNADERERALGYATGSTAAPGVTEQQRREALGRCIDANCLSSILAVSLAWGAGQATRSAAQQQLPLQTPSTGLGGRHASAPTSPSRVPGQCLDCAACGSARTGGIEAVAPLTPALQPQPGDESSQAVPSAPGQGRGCSHQVQQQQLAAPSEGGALRGLSSCAAAAAPALARGEGCRQGCQPADCSSSPSYSAARLTPMSGAAVADGGGPPAALPPCPAVVHAAAAVAAALDAANAPGASGKGSDIWTDKEALHMLQHGEHLPGALHDERSRVRKRLRYYLWQEGTLRFRLPTGGTRIVPPPADRARLIKEAHARTGHFGHRRTHAQLLTSFWWYGMARDVRAVLRCCDISARARSSFNQQTPQMQALEVMGLFYSFGLDLLGPLPPTPDGHRWVLVIIERLSKMVELVPLPDKTSRSTARALLQYVLGRYGAPAEVLTDRGSEWSGEFEELLLQSLVDHRLTSPSHPQANGLTERAVQTVKRALRRMTEERGSAIDWAAELPWIALGYNCTPQQATRLSPYQVLYARAPTVPPAVRERLQEPLDFDCTTDQARDALAGQLLERAALAKRYSIMAGENLRIAQHRDTLRYAQVRSGDYQPRLHRFEPGDFVYVKQRVSSTLQMPARPHILRVKEVGKSGVLVLEGSDGRTAKLHLSQCAPCHLPNIDTRVDYSQAQVEDDVACRVCGRPDDEATMLMCDGCNEGLHMHCIGLTAIPAGRWLCPSCVAQGLTGADLEDATGAATERARRTAKPVAPSHKQAAADLEARALHGRLVTKVFHVPGSKQKRQRPFWGRLHFRGPTSRPNYFQVTWEDSDWAINSLPRLLATGHKLQPASAKPPRGVVIPPALSVNSHRTGPHAAGGDATLPAV
jgi:transposase InsO family protein